MKMSIYCCLSKQLKLKLKFSEHHQTWCIMSKYELYVQAQGTCLGAKVQGVS